MGREHPNGFRNITLAIFAGLFFFIAPLLLPSLGSPARAAIPTFYLEKQEELVQRLTARGFSGEDLARIFSDDRVMFYPEIIGRSGKGIDYLGRRFGLLSKKSVREGKKTLQDHRSLLRRVESSYGVEKEILVAILRLETNFGRTKGTVPIFNSLLTLAVIENRRSVWAEEELAALLQMCRDRQRDPLEIRGSWAGAFGLSQFVPSSYIKYGVDGDGDGKVDLNNRSDALASIANYLKAFGWSGEDPARKKQALYAYNHCDNYVRSILTYARAIKPGSKPHKAKNNRPSHKRSGQA